MIYKIKKLLRQQRQNCSDSILTEQGVDSYFQDINDSIEYDKEETLGLLDHVRNAPEPEINLWISVEERLPEDKDDSVIVHFDNGAVEMVHIQDWVRDHFIDFYKVTHWMPLPEPPELGH